MSPMTDQVSEGGTGAPTVGLGGLSVPLGVHLAELRKADQSFQEERDRRYAEVATEREKALKIKETADLAALSLAREIQDYKDEKANELRSQIERERGDYATQSDLKGVAEKLEQAIKPLADYVTAQQGGHEARQGLSSNTTVLIAAAGLILAVLIATHAFG